MLQLGVCFAARGHDVDLVVAIAGGPLEHHVPPVLRRVDLAARRTTRALPALVRYLRRERPAALLSTLEHSNILAVWAAWLAHTGVRVVLREASPVVQGSEVPGLRPRVLRAFMRGFYPFAAVIVGVSKSVASDLVNDLGLPASKVRTIYNPIVAPDLESKASAALDDPWFAPGAPPVILAVGRLAPEKDFATLLRAFAVVRGQRPVRLVILGEGKERPMLERLVRELGVESDARLPGFEKNPLRYMHRSAVFVLSSLYEGLPGALIQAMACGCRVISTDCPGGVREILNDGALGPLVPRRDHQALARGIAGLLDDADRGPPRLRHPVERFTQESTVSEYLEVLGVGAGSARSAGSPR